MGVLRRPESASHGLVLAGIERVAPSSKVRIRPVGARVPDDLDAAFADMAQARDGGGLLVYSASFEAVARRGSTHVDRILREARPGDLPVERPTPFELVVNLRTARALSLTLPPAFLSRATG